jgi:DNA-binding LytR/AlgR family response regulator
MHQIPKILIVEDEVLIAEFILELLEEENYIQIKIAHDKEEAISLMQKFLPDIILMDINLNGKNSGIELSKLKNDDAQIIFLTGQYDRAIMIDALQTQPMSYLTKPINKKDLIAGIMLASFQIKQKYINVKDGYRVIKIALDDILFVKSEKNYIDIQLTDKKITIRQSLETFQKEMQSEQFLKIHRSYLVNVSKISLKKSNTIVLGTFEIPYSRNVNFNI